MFSEWVLEEHVFELERRKDGQDIGDDVREVFAVAGKEIVGVGFNCGIVFASVFLIAKLRTESTKDCRLCSRHDLARFNELDKA